MQKNKNNIKSAKSKTRNKITRQWRKENNTILKEDEYFTS